MSMPVFTSRKDATPEWCEMEYFEIVTLLPGETHVFERAGTKEKLILSRGRCRLRYAGQVVDIAEGTNLDLVDGVFIVDNVVSETVLVRMCGRWGDETGGSGLFRLKAGAKGEDTGDAVEYPKDYPFDNHFHDCDEYWIIIEGRGVTSSEGKLYELGPGDCLATGMGYHHDFPKVYETVLGVFFETTLEGKKRRGHLWEHKHGKVEPVKDRV